MSKNIYFLSILIDVFVMYGLRESCTFDKKEFLFVLSEDFFGNSFFWVAHIVSLLVDFFLFATTFWEGSRDLWMIFCRSVRAL